MYVQFNDGTINKGRDIKELARTIKTVEYGNTKAVSNVAITEKKRQYARQII